MNDAEFKELIDALDRSLAVFGERPADAGFDTTVYDELRRAREALIRARRDSKAGQTKSKRDSKSPLPS